MAAPRIISNYAWLPLSEFSPEQLDKLRGRLTFTPPSFGEEPVKEFKYYRETAKHIGLPREFYLANKRGLGEDRLRVVDGAPWPSPLAFSSAASLKLDQEELRRRVLDHLAAGHLGGIIQAATGFGKTVTAAALIASLGRTTLVIVHRAFLLRQWVRQLRRFLPGVQVGVIAGARCEYQGKHVVVAMVQTLAKREFSPEVRKHFGLVIPDEVHRHGARSWANVMGLFHARYRLGFSATPTRPDGAEVVIQAHCGPVIVQYTALRRPPRVRRIFTDFQLPELVKNTRFLPMLTLHRLLAGESVPGPDGSYPVGSAAARRAKVAALAVRAYEAGRKVLVFASWKVHLQLFQQEVLRYPWPGGRRPRFVWVIGGVSDDELRRAEAEPCIVLATYGYAREALDLESLDVMILLTPTSQVEQAVGRIAREHPTKKDPLILDIQDPLISKCAGMAAKREAQYLTLLGPDWNKP